MSDDTKPPVFRTYSERRAREEEIRRKNNEDTRRDYKLLQPKRPPSPRPNVPDPRAVDPGGPTRDMQPVRLPLKRKVEGEFADVLPFRKPE